jgi:hypothetical protein
MTPLTNVTDNYNNDYYDGPNLLYILLIVITAILVSFTFIKCIGLCAKK